MVHEHCRKMRLPAVCDAERASVQRTLLEYCKCLRQHVMDYTFSVLRTLQHVCSELVTALPSNVDYHQCCGHDQYDLPTCSSQY